MQKPFLVLLDLNGVLVQRINKGNREENRRSRQQRPPWRMIRKTYLWQRPYLRQFLDIVTTRHTVGIWSSAEMQSVLPILSELSSDLQLTPPLMQRLTYLRYRSDCRPDPQSGKYAVIKYLPDVWDTVPFSDRNTLIIDDTHEKVRHHPRSAVVIPEYSASNLPETFNFDDTLLWLLLYIEYLTSAMESRDFWSSSVAQIRPFLMTFEAFCNLGRSHASRLLPPEQLHQKESLSLVFLPKNVILYREPSEVRQGSQDAHLVSSGSTNLCGQSRFGCKD